MKKEILNIVLINLLVFCALIYIHEISHLSIAFCLGCKTGRSIAFDLSSFSSYTELYCHQGKNLMVYLGGLLISMIFGLLFIFLDKPTKNISFLILGFSLTLSSLDLALAFNEEVFYFSLFGGLLLIAVGEYSIASHSLENSSKTIYFQNKNFLLNER